MQNASEHEHEFEPIDGTQLSKEFLIEALNDSETTRFQKALLTILASMADEFTEIAAELACLSEVFGYLEPNEEAQEATNGHAN